MCFGFSTFFELDTNYKVWISSDCFNFKITFIMNYCTHTKSTGNTYVRDTNTSPTAIQAKEGTEHGWNPKKAGDLSPTPNPILSCERQPPCPLRLSLLSSSRRTARWAALYSLCFQHVNFVCTGFYCVYSSVLIFFHSTSAAIPAIDFHCWVVFHCVNTP